MEKVKIILRPNLGKPSGKKICLHLDFFQTALTPRPPAPCIFGTLWGTFKKHFFIWTELFEFWSSSPIFLGKCLTQTRKKYLIIFGIRHPPPLTLPEKCPNPSKKVPQKFWNKVTPPLSWKISKHKQKSSAKSLALGFPYSIVAFKNRRGRARW